MGRVAGVSQVRTATARELEGSGTEAAPGGTAAGGGDTWDVTSKDADEAGARGQHGVKQGEREKFAGRRENLSGEYSVVGGREGGPESS